MAAHLRSIVSTCQWHGCTSKAVVELYNTWNAPSGKFCKKHGQKALEKFKREHEQ